MAIKPYLDLSGGMNSDTAPMYMKDNECEIIQNYTLDNLGSLTKRKGIAYLIGQIQDGMNILNMYFNKQAPYPSNENILVGINASGGATSVIKKITSNAWADSKTGDTASAIPFFTAFTNAVYRVNGKDVMATSAALSSWSTSAVNGALQTILPEFICVWQDRVYAFKETNAASGLFPNRIYWSSLAPSDGSYVTWDATTQYADINPDDGDEITWGEPFGTVMLIFKENSMYTWNFERTEADRIPGTQGTPQGMTVKQTQGICFFANKYGVWALSNPYGKPQLISKKVQSFIDQIPTLDNMRAEVDQDHYKLFIGTVTVDGTAYTNCMLVYTISKNSWHIETYPFPIKAMARMISKTLGSTVLYDDIYLGDDDGFVYRTNTGNADNNGTASVAISGKILTKEYTLPRFPYKSDLKRMWVLAKYGIGARVNYRLDRIRERLWQTFSDIKERVTEKELTGKGRTIQLSITDNSIQSSQIEGFLIEDVDEKRSRIND